MDVTQLNPALRSPYNSVPDVTDAELHEAIRVATEQYEQADRDAAEDERVQREPAVAAATAAMEREINSDEPVSMRAKRMIMGDLDLGQHRYKHTDTMLPRKHQTLMTPLLELFGLGIIVIDIVSGEQRAALGFLAPTTSLNRWVPGDDYIVHTATENQSGEVECEVVSRHDIGGTDEWQLGKNRVHKLNEYPRKHIVRMARVMDTADAFKTAWGTMSLVFIWEREPRDDLASLINYLRLLTCLR